MKGRALLIGVALDGLEGVDADIDSMNKALTQRSLTVETCTGSAATRDAILAAYERLIESVEPGEAAVVYYSGHGGRVAAPPPGVAGPDPLDMQFIVPCDFHASTDDDFRAITAVEMSVLLARLTARTVNATVILDCCHAAHMSRVRGLRIRAERVIPPYERVRAHIERLRAAGRLDTSLLSPTGNPHAVRIVACAPEQSAFEYEGVDGRSTGILTESLAIALAEAGTGSVSWVAVADRVRRRVQDLSPTQRPEIEGPARRLLFDTAEDDLLAAPAVAVLDGARARIECAALLGVQVGDTFDLIAGAGAGPGTAGQNVGVLTIDRVGSLAADGAVTFAAPCTSVPLGTRAVRTTAGAPAMPVLLPPDEPRIAAVAREIEASPLLRAARPDEPWPAAVRLGADGGLGVEDRAGPLLPPRPPDPAAAAAVRRDLEALARTVALRKLAGDAMWRLGASVTVEWGTVDPGGRRVPLPASGQTVRVGQRVFVSARNEGPDAVYVSMVDIGVSGRITVLTNDSPSGLRLESGREHALGFDGLDGTMKGLELSWPAGLDPAAARPETVLVLVTEVPLNVAVLEQRGVGRAAAAGSPLGGLLEQIVSAGRRDLRGAGGETRYDAHPIDFELAAVPDEGAFLIDERPSPPALLLAPRGARPSGGTYAIRLEDLVVHRTGTLLGADVRVDTIVLTGERGGRRAPSFHARTERFPRIRGGQALPIDRMLLYHGPAAEYLDLAIWVSRDAPDSLGLGELLAQEVSGFELQEALAKMSDSVTAVPGVAAAATAVGLAALVVNAAYKLLRGHTKGVVGLYRGSMLAHEDFGAGRHPQSGTRPVQDFSLAFSVEEIGRPS